MGTIDITPKVNQKFPLQMWGMNLGIYEVTERNWAEFFVRVSLYGELFEGDLLRNSETGEAVPVTPELAKEHIGCRLGDRNEDRDAWWLRIMSNRARTFEHQVREFDPEQFPLSEDDDENEF